MGYDIDGDCSAPYKLAIIIFTALSTIFVILRFVSKKLSSTEIYWDDWLIILSLVSPDMVARFFDNLQRVDINACRHTPNYPEYVHFPQKLERLHTEKVKLFSLEADYIRGVLPFRSWTDFERYHNARETWASF